MQNPSSLLRLSDEQVQMRKTKVNESVPYLELQKNLEGVALLQLTNEQKIQLAELLGLSWFERGRIENVRGNYALASKLYQIALSQEKGLRTAIEEGDTADLMQNTEKQTKIMANLGTAYLQAGKHNEAKRYLEGLLEIETQTPEIATTKAKSLRNLSIVANTENDLEKETSYLEQLTQINSDLLEIKQLQADAMSNLGDIADKNNDPEKAKSWYTKLSELTGEEVSIQYYRAQAMFNLGLLAYKAGDIKKTTKPCWEKVLEMSRETEDLKIREVRAAAMMNLAILMQNKRKKLPEVRTYEAPKSSRLDLLENLAGNIEKVIMMHATYKFKEEAGRLIIDEKTLVTQEVPTPKG